MRAPSWLWIVLVVSTLAGCASSPNTAVGGGSPRCDRTGNEDQRRAC